MFNKQALDLFARKGRLCVGLKNELSSTLLPDIQLSGSTSSVSINQHTQKVFNLLKEVDRMLSFSTVLN